jgi:hypothetical protein
MSIRIVCLFTALTGLVMSGLQAGASSPDEWSRLDAQMKKAQALCRKDAGKEAGLYNLRPGVEPQFTAGFIVVALEGFVSPTEKTDTRQVYCLVSRRTGKAEFAGTMP